MHILIEVTILYEELLLYALRTLGIRQYILYQLFPAMSRCFSCEVLSIYCPTLLTVYLLKAIGLKDLYINLLILDHSQITGSTKTQ